jgi:hypothetical protein
MSKTDLSWTKPRRAASDYRYFRGAVVRGSHRGALRQTALWERKARRRMDAAHLERLVASKRRKKPAQSRGEHRLARTGGTYEEDVVTAGGRDLECAPSNDVAAYVCKIRSARGLPSTRSQRLDRRPWTSTPQSSDEFGQVPRPANLTTPGESRLSSAGICNDDSSVSRGSDRSHKRNNARNRS